MIGFSAGPPKRRANFAGGDPSAWTEEPQAIQDWTEEEDDELARMVDDEDDRVAHEEEEQEREARRQDERRREAHRQTQSMETDRSAAPRSGTRDSKGESRH